MKTAVEWFLENLRNLIKESELTDMRPNEFDAREMELLKQAKEMEKEQQIEFACQVYDLNYGKDKSFRRAAEDYYNKTFKNK
jgi:hypothetical protein